MKPQKFISVPIEASIKSSQFEDEELNDILNQNEETFISETVINTSDISHIIDGQDNTSTIYFKSNPDSFLNTLLKASQILALIYSKANFVFTVEEGDLPIDNQSLTPNSLILNQLHNSLKTSVLCGFFITY
jgi:hypothetical protein